MTNLEKISNADALIDAFNKSQQGSNWKASVQRYEANLLMNTLKLQNELRSGKYEQKDFYEFTLSERGKTRAIRSMHIRDRVVQRSICDNYLIPELSKYLIYDNGASIKDKGISFARNRLKTHLHKFYRHNGSNEGYVLLIDFSKFFDNIEHDKLIAAFREKLDDEEMLSLIEQMVYSFAVDVSYMSDEEYADCMNTVYNSIEHYNIDDSLLTGEKIMHKSIGIGSQISQIAGVFYPTKIDNYCKIVRQHKYYGRYMDDIYIIDADKNRLCETLDGIKEISADLGLHLNEKKTQIVKLSHGFTWLQIKYNISGTGKICTRVSPKKITRERRRLKKYRKLMDEGEMPYKDIEMAYKSWCGSMKEYATYNSLKNMDALYNELFHDQIKENFGNDKRRKRN